MELKLNNKSKKIIIIILNNKRKEKGEEGDKPLRPRPLFGSFFGVGSRFSFPRNQNCDRRRPPPSISQIRDARAS